MSSPHMTAADFEYRYRREGDPWGYESSGYEKQKYAATLAACGPGPFVHALELGASIGVFSERLAPRCQRLTTVDFAPSAVSVARLRLAHLPQVQVVLGSVPAAIPLARFDLIVASEILYYLEPDALAATLDAFEQRLCPGGRLVAVHWSQPGPERPSSAAQVHTALEARPGLHAVARAHRSEYLLDVLERAR